MGRKRKYKKEELAAKCEEYFRTISRIDYVQTQAPTGEMDSYGHMIMQLVDVLDRTGRPMTRVVYEVPPTVGGLCEFLGIHRSTWSEWTDPQKFPQYRDTVQTVRDRLRAYREEQLLTAKNPRGIIFDLQNNYGWSEKSEMELGEKTRKTVENAEISMTMEEKVELIRQAAQQARADGAAIAPDPAAGSGWK